MKAPSVSTTIAMPTVTAAPTADLYTQPLEIDKDLADMFGQPDGPVYEVSIHRTAAVIVDTL